jgi:hypothetical protein
METQMKTTSIVPVMKAVLEDAYTTDKMIMWASALARDCDGESNFEKATAATKLLASIWDEILVPAVCARLEKMRQPPKTTKVKRQLQNWNKTPERRLMKCILGHLIRDGKGKEALLLEFKRLIPDYQTFFDPPGVSDDAIWGRADTGRRDGKYAAEAPDTHFLTKPYWAAARQIVDDGVVLTEADVRRIAAEVTSDAETDSVAAEAANAAEEPQHTNRDDQLNP